MNFYALSGLINGLASSALGIFVYFRNRKGAVNKYYGLTTLAIGVWSYSYFFWQISTYKPNALFWCRTLMIGAIFIPPTYLHFVLALLDIHKQKKILINFLYIFAFVFFVFDFTPLLIRDVSPKLSFRFWPDAGKVHTFFLVFYFLCVTYAVIKMFKEQRRSSGIKRIQIRYVILGALLGFGGGATNFPLWYSIYIPPIGNVLVSVGIALMAYAILRYHLLDIAITIKKTTLLAAGVLLPAAGLIIGVNLFQSKFQALLGNNWWLIPSAVTVLLTVGLFRFVGYVVRLKDEELNKHIRHYRNQLRRHAEELAKAKTIRELVNYTVRHILTTARLDYCGIALKREEEIKKEGIIKRIPCYVIQKIVDRTGRHLGALEGRRIEENSTLIAELKNSHRPVEKGYLNHLLNSYLPQAEKKNFSEITRQMEEFGAELIFPSFSGDDLVGLLFLGHKLDGTTYSKEDIELFQTLSNQAAKPISEIITREENIKLILTSCHLSLAALEERDHYTRGHTERVKQFTLRLAQEEGLKAQIERIPDGLRGLELSAQMHDLGKIGIPDNVLNKPGKLTAEEFSQIKEHPQKALAVIGDLAGWLKEDIILGIIQHQEHYDGTGYPKGLKGDEIHIYARIIHVADALDAMTSDRPYRTAMPLEKAVEEIKVNSGRQFDPHIAAALIKLYQQKQF